MATNITDLAFEESGNDIVVRMWTGSNTTFDFPGITDIDFGHPAGVTVIYENEPESQAKVFIPYTSIQQIIQGL